MKATPPMSREPTKLGRPKNPAGTNKTKPSYSIPPDVIAALDDAAGLTGLSRSQLVTMCCKQRLAGIVKALTAMNDEDCAIKPLESVESDATPERLDQAK